MSRVKALLQELQDQFLDDESIVEAYGIGYSVSPERVVIKREKYRDMIQIYRLLSSMLTPAELSNLVRYVVETRMFVELGAIDDVSEYRNEKHMRQVRSRASKRGKRIIDKLLKKLRSIASDIPGHLKEALIEEESEEVAELPRICIGWLYTTLEHVNNGGAWVYSTDRHKEVYTSQSICLIPEYLNAAFKNSEDGAVFCSMCGTKCTRKSAFALSKVKTTKL